MQDLQREDRRAERCAEQDGEPGGHPRDRQDAQLVAAEVEAARDPASDGTRRLHERRLGTDRAPGGDPDDRDRDQRAQVADVVAAAGHVDVVDEQLDVAGVAEHAGQDPDQESDGREHAECAPPRPVRRADQVGQAAQRPDERGTGEPRCEPDGDHVDEEVRAHAYEQIQTRRRGSRRPAPARPGGEEVGHGPLRASATMWAWSGRSTMTTTRGCSASGPACAGSCAGASGRPSPPV